MTKEITLKQIQLKGESFSQTIMRLIKRQENFLKLAGAWKKIPESDEFIQIVEKTVKEIRNHPNEPVNLI